MKDKDLLKVLDMSEEEQWEWLFDNRLIGRYIHFKGGVDKDIRDFFLSVLAFGLRDEAVMLINFPFVCARVYNKAHNFTREEWEVEAPTTMMWIWFAAHARPIHWVIVALIAKENNEERKELKWDRLM